MAKREFNLAAVIGEAVPELDTIAGREQIEYIDIDLLDDDPKNFYELVGIDELAANIELFGMQQPLRVRANPEAEGRFIIVSGHRRRAANRLLVDEGKEKFRQIACIRERAEASDALQELRLIYANSDTRKLTSAEISKQAERVEALLYRLQEEGYEFPGRMRDHVAEACKVSKTKLARLKVIRDNLTPYFAKLYNDNRINESVAYEIAKMPQKHQTFIECHQDLLKWKPTQWGFGTVQTYARRLAEIDKVSCKGGGECTNCKNKYMASLKRETWEDDRICAKCCSKCGKLASCKYACPGLAGKIKQLKADAKAQKEQERIAQEERDRPVIQEIQKYWERFGQARAAADKSIPACMSALGLRSDYHGDEDTVMAKECLEYKFETTTSIPYAYVSIKDDIKRFVALADLLGCSLDYLFCRTDDPAGMAAPAPAPAGQAGAVWFAKETPPAAGQHVVVLDSDGFTDEAVFNGADLGDAIAEWDEVVMWTPFPKKSRRSCSRGSCRGLSAPPVDTGRGATHQG